MSLSSPLSPALVIAGPTASGKSGLALKVAEEFGGVIINADSMQVYSGLKVLTARPSDQDEAKVPHRLYGVIDPAQTCSAAMWRDLAKAEMDRAWTMERIPILVGGTGLYLASIVEGLSPIPEIPEDIRAEARGLMARTGNDAFHQLLSERDPVMAGRLHPGNSQRLVRAWEVLEATGRSLADWQAAPLEGAAPARWLKLVMTPERERLYWACDARFRAMVAAGALDEVRALMARDLPPALPAMKALGVAQLMAALKGEMELENAILQATQATRNYAKRQSTWFRHQMRDAEPLAEQLLESLIERSFPKIRQFLLTRS